MSKGDKRNADERSRTIADKRVGERLVLQQLEVERRAIPHLVVDVVEAAGSFHISGQLTREGRPSRTRLDAPRKENLDAPLDRAVGDVDAELCEARHGRGAHNGVLENDAVVDVADVLARLRGLGTLDAEEVQDADRELGELAVFDELAELRQGCARGGVEFQLLSIEADQAQRGGENAPASFESEMNLIMSKMASTTARLKS